MSHSAKSGDRRRRSTLTAIAAQLHVSPCGRDPRRHARLPPASHHPAPALPAVRAPARHTRRGLAAILDDTEEKLEDQRRLHTLR